MTEQQSPNPKKRGLIAGLRTSFLTGLVVVLPIGLTLYLIWTVTGWIDGFVLPFIPEKYQPSEWFGYWFCPSLTETPTGLSRFWTSDPAKPPFFCKENGINLRGTGVIIFLVFTIFMGWIARGLIGRSFLHWAERLVDRTPVVRTIYSGIKQIAETVFAQTDQNFEKACLVEYPKEGIWAIGFISTTAKGEIAATFPEHDEMLSVFLPTTPNPTSGFLLFVPSTDVRMLDMKIEDAAKLIISAGLVYPNGKDKDGVPVTQPPASVK
ncbi:DUF502 domain-containing protein [Pseudorhodobacter sp. E13]|uniref:DUF502 domain-containing protein n=1 Tax=Pseudorhodobacter sp. E13 TaxID=2487931 RepID=UPI000F8DC7BC|nr:DUF502 domain-containing protein [Pseudorhodobacter sp. E13]RUS60411.1 DUF502 domain-containing protein [Pseudorhodobacter sp. E13]